MSIVPNENDSFGASVTKTFALSTATTVGTLAGFIVIGLAVSKFDSVRKNRQAKKAAKNK